MLDVTMLGQFEVRLHGEPVDLTSRPLRLLLAYLMLHAGQTLSRAKVAGVLWPDSMESAARKNLRNYVWRLRQAVGEVYVAADKSTVTFDASAAYRLDVETLQRGIGEGSTEALIEAVSAYRGELLPGHYEEWVQLERDRLRAVLEQGMQSLLERLTAEERWSELVTWAEHWIAFGETPEPAYRSLMTGYAGLGDLAGVARAYRRCAQALEEELGVEPAPETQELYATLREGQTEVMPASEVPAQSEGRTKRHLPSPATPFIGRQKELAEVTERLEDGCRLLTLLGPGGSGKTRLAIELARRRVDEYSHGAAFVDLAPLSDPANIPTAVAIGVDFRFTSEGTPREQILNYLANKELLLVLDNFEHVLDGTKLVDDLLGAARGVQVIATSRARLYLGSECLFEVGGLGVEESEDGLKTVEAVQMFLEHARRVRPGFALDAAEEAAVARICRLVEGMPLAIELTAPWVRYLSPPEIARELAEDLDFFESERADLPERQRSMRAAFDHSWRFLDEDGRDALMKLSVFRGGASRRAARAVTGASLRALTTLADHALLTIDPDSGRFAVHELIRQFAMEKLEEEEQAEVVRDAHTDYYLAALADRLADLKGRDQLSALDAIERDFENVRAAWIWASEERKWEHIPEAGQCLFLFTTFRSRFADGIELFEAVHDAITAPTTENEQLAYTYALSSRQALLSGTGLKEESLVYVPELRAMTETLDNPAAVAYCQLMLGQVLGYANRFSEAIEVLEPARTHYQQAQEPFYTAYTLWRLGFAYNFGGKSQVALDWNHRGLEFARQSGDHYVAAALLNNLGVLTARLEGPTKEAENYYREAAQLQREMGAWAWYTNTLTNLSEISLQRGEDLATARSLLHEALALAAEQNLPRLFRANALENLASHQLIEGNYEEVLALTEELLDLATNAWDPWLRISASLQPGIAFLALGNLDEALRFMKRGISEGVKHNVVDYILSGYLPFIGILLAERGEQEHAVELIALGLTRSHARGRLEIDPLIGSARANLEEILGQERFAAAWERGKELDPLAVAEEVLATLEALEAAA